MLRNCHSLMAEGSITCQVERDCWPGVSAHSSSQRGSLRILFGIAHFHKYEASWISALMVRGAAATQRRVQNPHICARLLILKKQKLCWQSSISVAIISAANSGSLGNLLRSYFKSPDLSTIPFSILQDCKIPFCSS